MYEYDSLILSIYFLVTMGVFLTLTLSERNGFKIKRSDGSSIVDEFINKKMKSRVVIRLLGNYVFLSIPVIFIAICLMAVSVPSDIGYLSLILLSASLFGFVFLRQYSNILNKLVLYVTAAMVVYLDYFYLEHANLLISNIENIVYALIVTSIVYLIKFDDKIEFEMSPMDYLLAIIVVITLMVFNISPDKIDYGSSFLKLILLFYACELIEKRNITGFRIVSLVALLALSIMAFRVIV